MVILILEMIEFTIASGVIGEDLHQVAEALLVDDVGVLVDQVLDLHSIGQLLQRQRHVVLPRLRAGPETSLPRGLGTSTDGAVHASTWHSSS